MNRLVLILIVTVFLFSCADKVTKGGTGIETTNSISGVLHKEDGAAATYTEVSLRSSLYVPKDEYLTKLGVSPDFVLYDTTDNEGVFQFIVTDTGTFIVEAFVTDTSALLHPVQKKDSVPIDIGELTAALTGSLSGVVFFPQNESGKVLIQVIGTRKYALLDSGVVDFSITSLPQGMYILRITGVSPYRDPVEINNVVVLSGEITADLELTVSNAQTGGIKGKLAFPAGQTGRADIKLVESDSIIVPDSLTGMFEIVNLKAGRYILLGWGEKPFRDTVRVTVDVSWGEVTENIVLTLGSPVSGIVRGQVTLPDNQTGSYSVWIIENGRTVVPDVVTGNFEITDLDSGFYTLQAWGVKPPRDTVEYQVEMGWNQLVDTVLLKLGVPIKGGVSGTVFLPDGQSGSLRLQLENDTAVYTPDSSSGVFAISSLDSGKYTIKAWGVNPPRDTVSKQVEVQWGITTGTIDILLGTPLPGEIKGIVTMPEGQGGRYFVALEDDTVFVNVDTASGVFSMTELDSGEYTIQAWGIQPVRDTVKQTVIVKWGSVSDNVTLVLGAPVTGSITGNVWFSAAKRDSVIVKVSGENVSAVTDTAGDFILQNVPNGYHTLLAYKMVSGSDTLRQDSIEVLPQKVTGGVEFRFKLKALIVDGINDHDWEQISINVIAILEGSGNFVVSRSTSPDTSAVASAWDSWTPDYSAYDVILLNYNSPDLMDNTLYSWPQAVKDDFEAYVNNGGGVVALQSSHFIHGDWSPYVYMMGVGQYSLTEWQGYELTETGEPYQILVNKSSPATQNYEQHKIQVILSSHPITKGIPEYWLHTKDYVYGGLRGPAQNMTVLSCTWDSAGEHNKPVDWLVDYGKGKIYNLSIGYVDSYTGNTAMQCAGFQTMLIRGAEWVASGLVSYDVPADFPTETAVSIRDNLGSK
ncbi:MAG: ThuA domain-containing protein [Fibrobacteria bacterium]|nr:ThuA domain-containing protein [Fibrobacteria bacterium]